MFELLGLSLLLAALLTFNSLASLVIAGLWRVAGRATELERSRALVYSFLCGYFRRCWPSFRRLLVVPAYVTHEPRHAAETVSFKLGLLAFFSAAGMFRFIAALLRPCNRHSRPIGLDKANPSRLHGIDIDAFQIIIHSH